MCLRRPRELKIWPLEVVKVVQSYFIINDVKIFSVERDRKAKVSSTSIIEELG